MGIDRLELPSAETLREVLNYNPETGLLTWRVKLKPSSGPIAGSITSKGYVSVKIGRRSYYAHRLIWRMVTGQEPPTFIDHSDGDKANNAWTNLRPATARTNAYNSKLRKGSPSGVKGVKRHKGTGKWMATIRIDGELRYLGLFRTVEDASEVVNSARQMFHGAFARAA